MRSAPLLIAAVLLAVLAAPAGGQDVEALTFEHDQSRDIRSGFYPGDPISGDPIAARYPNTYETFPVTVPDGSRHSSLTAAIQWQDKRVNLDLSVYRLDADGNAINPAVARSATSGFGTERAVYAPPGATVEPGRYLVVVDNYCSRDDDPDPRAGGARPAHCGIGQPPPVNEDDFSGTVTLGNELPTVGIEGPDTTPAKASTTYEAVAEDRDGKIASYLFDLDGDGTYELDTDGNPQVTTTFPSRGQRTIGVQVIDDSGAVALATKTITVTRAVRKPDLRPPLTSFRLSGTSFGGAANRSLIISYKLREKSRVEVKLRRRGNLVRVIERGVRRAGHTYRIVLRPTRLHRGVYTLRIAVASRSGKHQVEQLKSRRR